ncbi:MAG TPA: hypothetical protein VHW91_03805 [Candidatus Dormibacteraeota bacterium]|nr:hypothetical protein [Candidatus Dormibacteraeota bacterium]
MPAPANHPVIAGVAVLLLVIAGGLLGVARRPTERLISMVALANATSGIVIAFWLVAGWTAFSASGRVLTVATAAGLIVLAVGELAATMVSSGDHGRA